MPSHSIILFDGVCNLCTGAVQFIIKRDKKNHLNFASLQSIEGEKLRQKFKLPSGNSDSFILIENNKAYTRSAAALRIAKKVK